MEIFAARFLDLLARHLQRGRIKEYARLHEQSSSPRGRIDVKQTLRLRARGIVTRVDHHRSMLHGDILINQLLALGLHAVESYVAVSGASPSLLTRARSYAALFDDVDAMTLQSQTHRGKARAFELGLSDARAIGDVSDALSYARALALNLGAWPLTEMNMIPETYFLNLESLFEDAVRLVAAEAPQRIPITRGATHQRPLFTNRDGVYVADPDLVMSLPGAAFVVADCKYKDLQGLPDHGDVYQLVAHAEAFSASEAVLIYPGETYTFNSLGRTGSGVLVSWVTVRIAELESDVESLIETLVPDHVT